MFWSLTRFAISDKLSHLRHNFWISKTLFSTSHIEFNTINKNRTPPALGKMEHGGKKFHKLEEQNQTSSLCHFVVYKSINCIQSYLTNEKNRVQICDFEVTKSCLHLCFKLDIERPMAEESSPDTDINLNTNGSCSAILSVLYMYVDQNLMTKNLLHPHKIT